MSNEERRKKKEGCPELIVFFHFSLALLIANCSFLICYGAV
jgi:hypothetical protein